MMNPLLEDEDFQKQNGGGRGQVKKIKEFLDEAFDGTLLEYEYVKSEIDSGKWIKLYSRKTPDNFITVIPWLRPMSMTIRRTDSMLGGYPRLNLTKQAKQLEDYEKCEFMLEICKRRNIWFLVVLPRYTGATMYWLARYDSIPLKHWALTYRKDKNNKDRMGIKNYKEYHFITLKELTNQVIKELKNGN